MANLGKILLVGGIVVGGGYLLYKGLSKANDVDVLINTFNFQVRLTKFKFSGNLLNPLSWAVNADIDVNIINPSKIKATIEKPYVEVLYEDESGNLASLGHSVLASPTPEITIGAQQTSTISINTISIPVSSMLAPIKRAFTNFDTSTITNITSAFSSLTNSLNALYPYLKVRIVTSYAGLTINKVFALG